ncbi:MAG: hypothetical protein RLO50_22140 [Azospirillaceae bacterium]
MKRPAECYRPNPRPCKGLPEIHHPFHEKTVTACGRICLNRNKGNFSTVFAGQKIGIKQATTSSGWPAS